ncbi:MAG: YqjF family protein [Blastocatellia bacterium]
MDTGKFLTAEWRQLVMLNYEIDPGVLQPMVPRGTELDQWQGQSYVSVVGFLFLKTRVLGVPIPFHRNFEEINLRFYVRRRGPEGWRRGVVFIKEIVPRRAIATVARVVYNENYVARAMRHRVENNLIEYEWREDRDWNRIRVKTSSEAQVLTTGSEEEFITEHYWGYAAQRDGGTVEYRVEHPPWRVWQVSNVEFRCDVERVYGGQFVEYLRAKPASAFVADGSAIVVRKGVRIC